MNAKQFFREFGIDKAREVVAASANALVQCKDGTTFHVDELKRLVKSIDEINGFGGIGMAKIIDQTVDGEHLDLEQAIADHDAIYSEQVK